MHERELALFRGYYLEAKRQLKNGTAKVRLGPPNQSDVSKDSG